MRMIWMALMTIGAISVYGATRSESFEPSLLPVDFKAVHYHEQSLYTILPQNAAEWNLSGYSTAGKSLWKSGLNLSENERVFHASLINSKLMVFTNIADYANQSAKIKAYQYSLESGVLLMNKTLWERNIKAEKGGKKKARLVASEELEIASIRSRSSEVLKDYRFELRLSPSQNVIMVSTIDYASERLRQEWKLFDITMKIIAEGNTEIDDLSYFYDFSVNDNQEVFQLLVSAEENIQVLKFSANGKDFDMLQLTAGNSVRDDLRLIQVDNDRLYAIGKAEADDSFYGVLYAVMNFKENEVERVHFEPLPIEIKNTADSLQTLGKEGTDNWMNYNITSVDLFNDEELLVVLETFDLRRSGHVFNDIEVADNLPWKEHKARITSGPAMVYSFDKQDELRWAKYLYKKVQGSESKIPQISSIQVNEPVNEQMAILVGDQFYSYKHSMDYIYNSSSKDETIQAPGVFIADWSSNDFKVFYSEKDNKLIIE